MKYIIYLQIASILVFTACGGGEKDVLKLKQAELETLRTEAAKIAEQITTLEAEIAVLDTTKIKLKLVNAIPVVETGFAHSIQFQGVADADENLTLVGEANGSMVRVTVKEGDYVSKGQVLIVVDAKTLEASKSQIETALSLAKTTFDRQSRLWNQKIGSEIQYLQAKNQVESLEKQIESIQANLDKFTVRAPISGYVDKVIAKQGEMMMPGAPLLRIVNLSAMKIKADISESYISKVKRGAKVSVKLQSINLDLQSTIANIGQIIDPANRTFSVEVRVPNSGSSIKPNMLARLELEDYSNSKAIAIESKFIQSDRFNNRYVFIAKKQAGSTIAVKTPVTIGVEYNGITEILSGLKVGDMLITEGSSEMSDALQIEIQASK